MHPALQELNDLFPVVNDKFMLETISVKNRDTGGNNAFALGDFDNISICDSGFPGLNIEDVGLKGHTALIKKYVAAHRLCASEIVCRDFGICVVVHVSLP